MVPQTYYIAEIGKACNGDLDYCWKLLNECKRAKVNGVRFHHYFLEESVHSSLLDQNSSTERTWSFKLKLPFENEVLFSEEGYKIILEWCQDLGLDFIATPWDIESYNLFKRIGVTDFKIHSMNAMNIPLLEKVAEGSSKLYISTGSLSEEQIGTLTEKFHLKSRNDVILLHAVCAYPAPETVINMRAMQSLRKFTDKVGYSSNDLLDAAILTAAALGADVIEKHIHLTDTDQVIHKASISIDKYANLIAKANQISMLLGIDKKHESRGEMINQEILSKSVVLKNDVKKGEILDERNLTLQLPSKGINAKQWYNVVGKRAAHNLTKGNYLFTRDMLEQDNEHRKLLAEGCDEDRIFIPGKLGIVARLTDIEQITKGRNIDYVEVHYAASDLDKEDYCKDYDLDLVVHFPEYANGRMLDLCSYDGDLRKFSIEVINRVMQKARELKPHFKRCRGDLKFVLHPGAMTFPKLLDNPKKQADLFADSLSRLDSAGLEVLVENMLSFAWFLDDDWSAHQGLNNSFMDADDLYDFCTTYNYGMCLDLCHAKLYTSNTGKSLLEYMKKVKPIVKHLHYSDCVGIDGEGLQVGDGDIDWGEVCEVFYDHKYGWTPEIWNGHHDNGQKFCEAHARLNMEFKKYRSQKDN